MTEYKLWVPGIARTSGSHKTLNGRIVHANPKVKDWMDKIAWLFMARYGRPCLLTGACYLSVMVYLSRPKGDYGKGKNAGKLLPSAPKDHIKMPDLDKLVRAIQDALTKVVWRDDSQVNKITAEKHYENTEHTPGILLYVKGEFLKEL